MLEEKADGGIEGGVRREEPLVRDCVVFHEEEKKSDARVLKGSDICCASLWIPFSPFVYKGNKENNNKQLQQMLWRV